MGRYEDIVASRDFPGEVATIRSRLAGWSEDNQQAVDQEDDGILQRIELLLDEVLVVTAIPNQWVVPAGRVGELAQALADLNSAVTALTGVDENTVTVPAVAALTDAAELVAAALFQWPPRADGDNWREAVTSAASTYRRSAGQQISALLSEIQEIEQKISDLRNFAIDLENVTRQQVDQRRAEIENQLSDLGTAVNAVSTQVANANTQITRAVERADQAIAQQQQQFSSAQDERAREFRASANSLVTDAQNQFQSMKDEAATLLGAIQQQVDEAGELVSVFAAAGTANAFSKEAQEQKDLADRWRRAAIVLGFLAAIAALSVFLGHKSSDPQWDLLAAKLAVGLALGGIASYAARQSGRHRHREETARHLELNIAAFGPFVRELDPAKQEEARGKVVDAIFLRPMGGGDKGATDPAAVTDAQINLIGRLFDAFKKLR